MKTGICISTMPLSASTEVARPRRRTNQRCTVAEAIRQKHSAPINRSRVTHAVRPKNVSTLLSSSRLPMKGTARAGERHHVGRSATSPPAVALSPSDRSRVAHELFQQPDRKARRAWCAPVARAATVIFWL